MKGKMGQKYMPNPHGDKDKASSAVARVKDMNKDPLKHGDMGRNPQDKGQKMGIHKNGQK
jgi:hypothetical protein